ncbi:MAG: hypothetical protein GFH27_549431n35 [Chloroflexi bacterium AL-W]|nr:hypothetical protein [Chloroflexi bacterium AL-N1]NOK71639.1 hypothetical protein [Chloroflexi bacterium AL-N10]NOK78939.1 hypothetical protein [Chloroflexi bacterium AL-N5]NOK86414.1 hypothetical protein [Chloroflexi bacterium AL-W]
MSYRIQSFHRRDTEYATAVQNAEAGALLWLSTQLGVTLTGTATTACVDRDGSYLYSITFTYHEEVQEIVI